MKYIKGTSKSVVFTLYQDLLHREDSWARRVVHVIYAEKRVTYQWCLCAREFARVTLANR